MQTFTRVGACRYHVPNSDSRIEDKTSSAKRKNRVHADTHDATPAATGRSIPFVLPPHESLNEKPPHPPPRRTRQLRGISDSASLRCHCTLPAPGRKAKHTHLYSTRTTGTPSAATVHASNRKPTAARSSGMHAMIERGFFKKMMN
jgi:hypothetical protein